MKKLFQPCCICALLLFSVHLLPGQQPARHYSSQSSEVRLLGKTPPLRDMTLLAPVKSKAQKEKARRKHPKQVPNFQGNIPMSKNNPDPLPRNGDPLRHVNTQRNFSPVVPLLTFEGMDMIDSGTTPPDPVGDISPDHYIQMINAGTGAIFQIWDKEGNPLTDPISANTFWQPFNVTGLGDPIILYDQEAGRWLISEMGFFGSGVMLVAISETSDPMGSWFAYEFQTPTTWLPDYPKYAFWDNAYYVTTNEPGDPNIPIYVLQREAMLAGEATAGLQRLGIPKFSAPDAFQVAIPVEWDGAMPPPPGSPGLVVRAYDDAWNGGQDKLEIWEVHVDWNDENNSFVSGPIEIPLAPFDMELCDGDMFFCIEQPNGQLMSALQQIIMFRVPYRNFNTHESIVLNFSVDVNGNNQAGIRWVELRKSGDEDWSLYQEGTYAPDDDSRFMGSIAQDGNGNILLGYSVTGENTFLSERFTGQQAGGSLGEMDFEEFEIATGGGIQPTARWGDYAAMTVDPVDQRTFWFTGEYQKNSNWSTVITKVLIQRDSNDVGLRRLVMPQNSGYLTDSETVQVEVRNFGYNPQTDFGIHYRFEGGPVISEMITDTIPPDSVHTHTFTPTVDMEEIGPYDFLVFTTLASDSSVFNDTLRTVVTQLPRNDAAVDAFQGIDIPVCGTVVTIGIVIINSGVDTLYSVNVYYHLNEDEPVLYEWTGVLPPGESDVITVAFEGVVLGAYTINAYTELPNGIADENPDNDNKSRNFLVLGDGIDVRLELMTDGFPTETTWEIRDLAGDLLYTGGPYNQPNTLIVENFCLGDTCYVFTIFDSFGDGLDNNPPFIQGSYRLINEDDVIVAGIQEPNFGFEEVNEFCSDLAGCSIGNLSILPESGPGANDGKILVTGSGGRLPYQYSIDDGENFQYSPLFNNLAGGIYNIVIKDANDCINQITVTVGTCSMMLAAETQEASNTNSTDGVITAIVTGGIPPFKYKLDNGAFQADSIFVNISPGDYLLTIRDDLGCTTELNITVGFSVETQDNFFGTQIQLFPNPTEGRVRILVKGLPAVSVMPIVIYDASGQVVKRDRMVRYDDTLIKNVSLYELPEGVYFILLAHDEFNHLLKVIKG